MGLDVLVSATEPGTTVVTPYEWSPDTSWKDKVFTKEQPFLAAEAKERWLQRNQAYRDRKNTSKV